MRNILFFLLLSGLTSCAIRRLDIQTLYLTQESLASAIVCTPDVIDPLVGQRLLVQWNLRREFFNYRTIFFKLIIRFHNHHEQTICKRLTAKQGTYLYELLGKNYDQTGGIATYRLEIFGDNCLIDSWQHPLWTNLITFENLSQKKDPTSSAD